MDWLIHNPIADMYGPNFLIVYAIVAALIALHARWSLHRHDPTLDLDPLPLPKKPDPHAIAYLRGGCNELIRLVVFDLMRRGYLHATDDSKIVRTPGPPGGKLSALEHCVFGFFDGARKPEDIFQPGKLSARVQCYCEPLEESLRDEQLIASADRYRKAFEVWLSGAAVIVALGGYKLMVALGKGRHNVGGIFLVAFVGLLISGAASYIPRLTGRGRDYVGRLRQAFEGLKVQDAPDPRLESGPGLCMLAAIFGVGVLAATPYFYVPELFRKASASSGGGCGSGCGGGCGGGGCGGGGCGGGGCGGCGG